MGSDTNIFRSKVELEPWFVNLLRDPMTKLPLGFYRTVSGNLDLRPPQVGRAWNDGQIAYEVWEKNEVSSRTVDYFRSEIESVKPVYAAIPLRGDVLDVGGLDGRVRAFIDANQRYACVDPYPDAISDIDRSPALLDAYPFMSRPINFVCGMAEYLPIADESFDTVHMRSVIDHFEDVDMALSEARRALRENGQIVIGVSVLGGESGCLSFKERARELARWGLVHLGAGKYRDHHIWHPTWPGLKALVESAGFQLSKVFWQNSRVVYLSAIKH